MKKQKYNFRKMVPKYRYVVKRISGRDNKFNAGFSGKYTLLPAPILVFITKKRNDYYQTIPKTSQT
ncbi:MAG: hypothetical protein JSV24_06270 [Bacteroidales bacterium]|nr:MAG: hypothetical protein JSV24_06270 [Bacteroidales bacterium]